MRAAGAARAFALLLSLSLAYSTTSASTKLRHISTEFFPSKILSARFVRSMDTIDATPTHRGVGLIDLGATLLDASSAGRSTRPAILIVNQNAKLTLRPMATSPAPRRTSRSAKAHGVRTIDVTPSPATGPRSTGTSDAPAHLPILQSDDQRPLDDKGASDTPGRHGISSTRASARAPRPRHLRERADAPLPAPELRAPKHPNRKISLCLAPASHPIHAGPTSRDASGVPPRPPRPAVALSRAPCPPTATHTTSAAPQPNRAPSALGPARPRPAASAPPCEPCNVTRRPARHSDVPPRPPRPAVALSRAPCPPTAAHTTPAAPQPNRAPSALGPARPRPADSAPPCDACNVTHRPARHSPTPIPLLASTHPGDLAAWCCDFARGTPARLADALAHFGLRLSQARIGA